MKIFHIEQKYVQLFIYNVNSMEFGVHAIRSFDLYICFEETSNYRYMFLKNKIVLLKINAMWIILLICMPRTLGAGVLHAYEIVRSCVQFCAMSIPTDIFIN